MIINRESVKELTSKLSEPTWLADSRLEAWESYLQTAMPTGRDEDWRRTDIELVDLTRLETRTFEPARAVSAPGDLGSAEFRKVLESFEGGVSGSVFLGTAGGAIHLSPEAAEAGAVFCDIATAVEKHGDLLRRFMLEPGADKGKFGLLTRALFNCGAVLFLPRNASFAKPFVCGIEFSTAAAKSEHGAALFPRILVVAEDNSSADFVLVLSRPAAKSADRGNSVSLASSLIDFNLAAGARINYLEVQDFSSDVFYIERLNSSVARDASFNSLCVALGGKQTKADIATFLKDRGATSKVFGAVLGSNSEKFSYNTIQEHNAPDTTSDINFRVALKDQSSSVYQGIIRVDKVAQRTNAYQSNKNLLLGGEAKADSIPKLEILADDVKCSHGATVGPVDREQLFYLRSRGLTAPEAEELVVLGFFNQILEEFPVQSAMGWLSEVVSGKVFRSAATPTGAKVRAKG